MARYQDKVVIVTGGSKGIGEGCVRVFVQNGSKVVLCARGEKDGLKLVEELNAKGERNVRIIDQCRKHNRFVQVKLTSMILLLCAKLVANCISKGPGECHFIKCDMSSESDIKNLIDQTIEKYGRLDCLINNAGTHPPCLQIDDFSVQDFKDLLNINLVR